MPLYSEYIRSHSLAEICSDPLKNIQKLRGLELSNEQAAKLPRCLGQTAVLPIAVACEYLHRGRGLPAIFAFDLFQACLASCQHKALEVTLYGARSKSFSCKARWWACPTGDPNAGKSPTCSFVMKAFARMIESLPQRFLQDQHWIGVGNNNRIQNRLRALQGTLLLYGPESKPILDPNFPAQKKVDTGKYLDLTRWLESANGGSFEWGTGAEELERQKRKASSNPAAIDTTAAPLVFDPTNINICLFQQFSLFEDCWCQVESLHKCGFSARILMSPTGRAFVEREVGLQDPEPIAELMKKVWRYVATVHGPHSVLPSEQLQPSVPAQTAIRNFYYDLDKEDQKGGWGSAMKSALGKMEYHVPTAACLSCLASCSLQPAASSTSLDDNAIKASIRHFALCVCQSCAIVDSTVRTLHTKQKPGPRQPSSSRVKAPRRMTARVLEACPKNPILESHRSSHFSAPEGADKRHERQAIMEELHRLGLGDMKEAKRRQGGESRCMEFHRHPLTPAISAVLLDLSVPELLWPQAAGSSASLLSPHPGPVPHMAGCGVFRTLISQAFPNSVPVCMFDRSSIYATLPSHRTVSGTSSIFSTPGRCSEPCPLPCSLPISSPTLSKFKVAGAFRPHLASELALPSSSYLGHQRLPPMHGAGKRGRAAQEPAPDSEEAKDAKKDRVRPSAKEVDDLYSMQETLPCEQEQLSKADFPNQEKAWASSLVSDRNLRTKGQFAAHAKGFKVHLWCNSCDACQDRKGWKAICTYNRGEKLIHRKSTPLASHGDFNAARAWNPLTFLDAGLGENCREAPARSPDRCIPPNMGKNHRVHKGSAKSRASSFKWVESDWRQLERDLGTALEAVNELKIAGLLWEREQTAIIFCNPMLLEETLHSLTNRVYIKLCGDGTFRLTEEDWVLMTVGACPNIIPNPKVWRHFALPFTLLFSALPARKASQLIRSCSKHCVLAPRNLLVWICGRHASSIMLICTLARTLRKDPCSSMPAVWPTGPMLLVLATVQKLQSI
jgi:hypothetical protein